MNMRKSKSSGALSKDRNINNNEEKDDIKIYRIRRSRSQSDSLKKKIKTNNRKSSDTVKIDIIKNRDVKQLAEMIKSDDSTSKHILDNINEISGSMKDLKPIQFFTESDIKDWVKAYNTKLHIFNVYGHEDEKQDYIKSSQDEVLAVVYRGIELTTKFALRDTQKLAISILLKNRNNTLACVSYGEGKTLIAVALAIIKFLQGERTFIICRNSHVANRKTDANIEIFKLFGISVSSNCSHTSQQDAKDRYQVYFHDQVIFADLTFVQYDFSNIRIWHNIHWQADNIIINEVDSILPNEKHKMYLCGNVDLFEKLEPVYDDIWKWVTMAEKDKEPAIDFETCTKHIPKYMRDYAKNSFEGWIDSAETAFTMQENLDYKIDKTKNTGIEILEKYCGGKPGMYKRKNDLIQFLQIKHDLEITRRWLKPVLGTNIHFFKMFKNIYGLPSAPVSKEENNLLKEIYNFDYVCIPTSRDLQFNEMDPIVCSDKNEWLKKIVNGTTSKVRKGISVLMICEGMRDVNDVHTVLKDKYRKNITIHTQNDSVLEISKGQVIISTILDICDTSIKITKKLQNEGELHVCLTYFPDYLIVEQEVFGKARRANKASGQLIIKYSRSECSSIETMRKSRELQYIEGIKLCRETQVKEEECLSILRDAFVYFPYLHYSSSILIFKEFYLKEWGFLLHQHKNSIVSIDKKIFEEFILKIKMFDFSENWSNTINQPYMIIRLAHSFANDSKIDESIVLLNQVIEEEPTLAEEARYRKVLAMYDAKKPTEEIENELHKLITQSDENVVFIMIAGAIIESFKYPKKGNFLVATTFKTIHENLSKFYKLFFECIKNKMEFGLTLKVDAIDPFKYYVKEYNFKKLKSELEIAFMKRMFIEIQKTLRSKAKRQLEKYHKNNLTKSTLIEDCDVNRWLYYLPYLCSSDSFIMELFHNMKHLFKAFKNDEEKPTGIFKVNEVKLWDLEKQACYNFEKFTYIVLKKCTNKIRDDSGSYGQIISDVCQKQAISNQDQLFDFSTIVSSKDDYLKIIIMFMPKILKRIKSTIKNLDIILEEENGVEKHYISQTNKKQTNNDEAIRLNLEVNDDNEEDWKTHLYKTLSDRLNKTLIAEQHITPTTLKNHFIDEISQNHYLYKKALENGHRYIYKIPATELKQQIINEKIRFAQSCLRDFTSENISLVELKNRMINTGWKEDSRTNAQYQDGYYVLLDHRRIVAAASSNSHTLIIPIHVYKPDNEFSTIAGDFVKQYGSKGIGKAVEIRMRNTESRGEGFKSKEVKINMYKDEKYEGKDELKNELKEMNFIINERNQDQKVEQRKRNKLVKNKKCANSGITDLQQPTTPNTNKSILLLKK